MARPKGTGDNGQGTDSVLASPENNARNNRHPEAKVLSVSQKGVVSAYDFASFMSALMCDVVEGKIEPRTANAAVSVGRTLIKAVEMQHKYSRVVASPSQAPNQVMFLS